MSQLIAYQKNLWIFPSFLLFFVENITHILYVNDSDDGDFFDQNLNLVTLYVCLHCFFLTCYWQVIGDKKWREVTNTFNFPSSATNASFILRKYYISLLRHYEQSYFFRAKGWTKPSASLYLKQNLLTFFYCDFWFFFKIFLHFFNCSMFFFSAVSPNITGASILRRGKRIESAFSLSEIQSATRKRRKGNGEVALTGFHLLFDT